MFLKNEYCFVEESYNRVMKYEDEQVDVNIHINDIEKMVS